MRALAVTMFAFSMLLGVVTIAADEPPVPEPTDEHRALGMWIGSWSGSGEMKPGPFGPGGAMTWNEECEWFHGSAFHVVCRSEGTSPMGPSKGLGIIGYNSYTGKFTHYAVDSAGWAGYAEGTRSGETWTYFSEEVMGDVTYMTKYTVTQESPSEVSFTWAVSADGGTSWDVLMEGTSTKR
jgi:hypothetical protein